MLGVDPVKFLVVEHGRTLVQSCHREHLAEFIHRKDLALVLRRPTQQGDVVDDGFRKIAFLHQRLETHCTMTFRELAHRAVGVLAVDQREVDIARHFPAKSLIQQDVFGIGRQVFAATDDVRDAHQVVVHHIGEVIRWHAVALQQDLVVEGLVLNGDFAIDEVVEGGGAFMRHLLTDHIRFAFSQVFLHFFGAQVTAMTVALEGILLGFLAFCGFLFRLGAEAVVSCAFLDELHGVFLIDGLTLTLDVRAIVAAHIRAFIMMDVGCFEGLVNHASGIFHIAFLVGVLDTEHKLTVL